MIQILKKHPVGRILPESIGADKNLFENNQTQGENKKEDLNFFHTKCGEGDTSKDESSLNPKLNIDSNLNLEAQEIFSEMTDMENNHPTVSQKQAVTRESLQVPAPSLHLVPDQKEYSISPSDGVAQAHTIHATSLDSVQDRIEYSDSQSVTDTIPSGTHLTKAGTADICKKFKLDPEKLNNELKDVFQNVSPLINLLAPKYKNILPSLDNLLKLALRVKKFSRK